MLFGWGLRGKAYRAASRLFETAPHRGSAEWQTHRHVCLRFIETSPLEAERYRNWPPEKLAIVTCLHALDIHLGRTSIPGEPQRKLTGVGALEAFDLYFHFLEAAKADRLWPEEDLEDMAYRGRTGRDPDQRIKR